MTILIVGIGQSLRSDDGAGLVAVQQWERAYPASARHPDVIIELAELPGVSLLDALLGSEAAILVDAMRSGAPPGSLHLLREEELDIFAQGSSSAHGLGVAETLALGRQLYPGEMPQAILLGIEAGEIGLGESLSAQVQAAIPAAAALIEKQVQILLNREIRE